MQGTSFTCPSRRPERARGAAVSVAQRFAGVLLLPLALPLPVLATPPPVPAAVGARPLKDPVLELPVFDIMATAFQPLPNPNPRGLEAAPGTEDVDAPASPAAAPAASTVTLNPRVWSEPLRVDVLHR